MAKGIANVNLDPCPAVLLTVRWWNRDVHRILTVTRQWNQKTVATFLTRLVDKGVAMARADGRAFRYRARASREQSIIRESESFLQRVFRGAAGPMLAHFCEQTELTQEEITRLEEILRRKKG